MTSRNQALLFARNFLRYPKVLGSVIPSSRFLVDNLLKHVDWAAARLIVEYGPGVGTFTGEILRRMRPDAQLIAIELNDQFVEFLGANYSDPRLRVVRGSALEVDTFLRELERADADAIVSGIPFSTISLELRGQILQQVVRRAGPRRSLPRLSVLARGGAAPARELRRRRGGVRPLQHPAGARLLLHQVAGRGASRTRDLTRAPARCRKTPPHFTVVESGGRASGCAIAGG